MSTHMRQRVIFSTGFTLRFGAASKMDDSEQEPLPAPSSPSSDTNSVQLQDVVFSVLLFASLKDAAQCDRISVRVAPTETSTQSHHQPEDVFVSDLLRCCAEQHPRLARWLPYVKVAVNCEYARSNDNVSPTDEIALLPPVSGGATTKRIAASSRF